MRYVYAEAAAEEPVAPLRPEVAALPGALRHQLADALVCLDVGCIAGVIDHVGQQDAILGRVLAHYADHLAFASILKALEAGVPPSPEQ